MNDNDLTYPGSLPALLQRYEGRRAIASGFVSNSELADTNTLLIANLHKRSFPAPAPALFRRIWTEAHKHFLDALNREQRGIFRRLKQMRVKRERLKANK